MKVPHPIPYQGSKRLLAPTILQFFPKDIDTLFEPFAGSAAVTLAAAARGLAAQYVISDTNEALICLWQAIVDNPEIIAEEYRNIWERQLGDEANYYNKIREQFNKSGKPEYFLFLLVRCVKAAIRYNANGEFNQSPDHRRKGTNPTNMMKEIMSASLILKGKTNCLHQSYLDILNHVKKNDLVYMDPPYQGVSQKKDSRYQGGLLYEEFVERLQQLNALSISYIVSYDGRTGNKLIGNSLPLSLKLTHLEIPAGRSSQATLLGRNEITYESLYISPALRERLALTDIDRLEIPLIKQMELAL